MHPVTRHYGFFVLGLTLYLPLLLLADSPGWAPQVGLGAATAGFLWLATRRGPVDRRQIVTAIVVATIGECVLSLGWGLYSYQNALIPLYVPFGHGIFYAIAAESAQQRSLQRFARRIIRGVVAAGTLIAIVSLIAFNDTWGMLWWIIAAALILRGRNGLLLSACFVYTMPLEWIGTAIGNWTWAAEVPYVGLTSANPPSGVGLLYVLLDMIVVALTAWQLPSRSLPQRLGPVLHEGYR